MKYSTKFRIEYKDLEKKKKITEIPFWELYFGSETNF